MMLSNKQVISVSVAQSTRFLHLVIHGLDVWPVKFDMVDLDGKRVVSRVIIYGNEISIPIRQLAGQDYLYAISFKDTLKHTGVISF